ncbi:hypothetical protein J2X11_001685 [Aeromicrobium panaciterrae]|uniref:Immunity protein 35 domain-containing protein n=1 Tax=Aeromicrobium panaciterrae TaxID=363861 RepID=A0ABU1UNT8_9ACTN|nr:hypothetical protein [Aeromicrobium panaciterrae]MDR7086846.1 hypothetical protein [Aeromicrobium panaciterrae]
MNSDVLPRPFMWRLRLAVAEAHGIAARMSPEDADLLALATVYLTDAPFPIIGVRADATHYSPDYEPLPEGVLYVGGNPFFVDRRTTEVSSLVSYDCAMKRSEMTPTEPLPQANNRWNDIRFQLGADDEPVTHSMDDALDT